MATKIKYGQTDDTITAIGLSRQTIINGGFTVNQRVYVSNATLSAGSYGHDRWKAGSGGGGGAWGSPNNGRAGGSGIVIVRYLTSDALPGATGNFIPFFM